MKTMKLFFEPADDKEHKKTLAGEDVPDYCRNCFHPWKKHTLIGHCPNDADCGEGVAV